MYCVLSWAQAIDRPVHVLFSKSDQLSRSASAKLLKESAPVLSGRGTAQLFSAHKKVGLDEARARLDGWLAAGEKSGPG